VRQPAGAAPPDGAAPVVEAAGVLLLVLVAWLLLLPLLPQPATTSTMEIARHALRTEPKKTRSAHWPALEPWMLNPEPVPPPLLEPIELLAPPRPPPPDPGGGAGRSNVWVLAPTGVVSCAEVT
jgi:hypothetical protein